MKKLTLAVAALTLAASSAFVWADDANTQPSPAATAPGNAANAPSNSINPMMAAQGAQTPPDNWTSLKGTVQQVDPAAKTVQIKDDSGSLIQVPVDKQVSIQKDGQKIKLSQVQTGDTIVLAKRNASSQDQGSKTY